MRMQSWAAIAVFLLAFACKKENGKKSTDGPSGAQTENSGDQTGNQSGTSGPIGDDSQNPADIIKTCPKVAAICEDDFVASTPAAGFKDKLNKAKQILPGGAVHRARDVIMNYGQDANLIVKFAYGILLDGDVKGEDVDIYQSLGCKAGWKKIGSAVTSLEPKTGEEKTVDGIPDNGGYVMTSLSALGLKDLAVGRHHLVFLLKATNEKADLYIEVLPKNNAVVVSDIDGTLTAFEEAAAADLINLPVSTHTGAPEMMQKFYERGYTIFYLTARPVFFMEKTRKWLDGKNFPPGIIHTTSFVMGAVGDKAAQFKVDELAMLKTKLGIIPSYAFGNKPSDVKAFADAGIDKMKSWFYKISGDTTGAQAHSDYTGLIPMAEAATSICQ